MKHLPKEIFVTISYKNIREGIHLECSKCPLALAIKDSLPLYGLDINVTNGFAHLKYEEEEHYYTFDDDLRNFIRDFDAGREVFPLNSSIY